MEQTLGKIISTNRKRLGLTQDQLAEKLGVTPQAISKWENDQSCPDIAMLLKLAEIFGITTDQLLGREEIPVREAEVVNPPQEEKGGWQFQWNAEPRNAIGFGVFVLLLGALTFIDAWMDFGIGFWSICWPSAIFVYGLFALTRRFTFFPVACVLFGGYNLLSRFLEIKFQIEGNLVPPILFVVLGVCLLVDALRKPKKPSFRFVKNGEKAGVYDYKVNGEHFSCELSFSSDTRRIELPRLSSGEMDVSFGDLTVDLSGCQVISDGCHLEADCSFGQLVLLVPRKYSVQPNSDTTFASVTCKGKCDDSPAGIIYLESDVSFGSMVIHYV